MNKLIYYIINKYERFSNCPSIGQLAKSMEQEGLDVSILRNLSRIWPVFNEIGPTNDNMPQKALRIYSAKELRHFPKGTVDFFMFLEKQSLLNLQSREFLINTLLHLDLSDYSLDNIYALSLLIIWVQSGNIPQHYLHDFVHNPHEYTGETIH